MLILLAIERRGRGHWPRHSRHFRQNLMVPYERASKLTMEFLMRDRDFHKNSLKVLNLDKRWLLKIMISFDLL